MFPTSNPFRGYSILHVIVGVILGFLFSLLVVFRFTG